MAAAQTVSRNLWSLVAVAFATAVFFVPAGQAATPSPVKDPNLIACPSAPSGWTYAPVRKTLATPESVPEPDAEEHLATGGNLVTVACTYWATDIRQVTVRVTYDLPTDINPINDFYVGCGNGNLKWNSDYRVYRVASDQQWANAFFDDFGLYMPDTEVPTFQRLANQLLQNASGFGHDCTLKVAPTELMARYTFDIRIAGANLKSIFYTKGAPDIAGTKPIVSLARTSAPLQVKANGKTRRLTIKFTDGIDYSLKNGGNVGTARFKVKVTQSGLATCRAGQTGTLTISTQPAVLLDICGQTFLRGDAPRRIRFFP
jgi:hypothetical protein